MTALETIKRMIRGAKVSKCTERTDKWIKSNSDTFLMILYIAIVLLLQALVIFLAVSDTW